MKLLTSEQQEFNIKMKKFLKTNMLKIKKYCKVGDHCHYTGECRGAVHSICCLKYFISKESDIIFHNASNYDYHFTLKELAEELDGQ